MHEMKDRVVIVTGASRGIGEAIAKALAAHGAHVIVSSRKAEDCEKVAGEIRQARQEASESVEVQ